MSVPAASTDNKSASLLVQEDVEVAAEAPPSYTETPGSNKVMGDGNVYSDLPRPGMTYAAGQAQTYVPRAERKSWTVGFFDCFSDPGSCAKAFCCPCVSYGQTRHRLHSPNTPAPVCSTPCLGYCLTASFFPGAESIFGLLQRNELRQRLNINQRPCGENEIRLPGGRHAPAQENAWFESLHTATGFLDDAWRHFFCGCCSLVQEDREVRSWEKEVEEEGDLGSLTVVEEGIEEEGDRLLGSEREVLRGLRG